VVGAVLLAGISLEDKALFSSGRISSEIFSKALRCRIPVLVAAGAPTNQAVKLARQVNMALAGRTRGNRTIIYSAEERII
jgi:FdhD protein